MQSPNSWAKNKTTVERSLESKWGLVPPTAQCSTAVHCSTAVLSRFRTSFSLTLLSWILQTRLASSAPRRLRTIVEHYCSTANCSTAVLSRFPTSVSLTLLSRTLRLASQARQEGGWGQPPNNGRLRTIVAQYCSTANC